MHITYERAGGVAGMVTTVELDTRKLTRAESNAWEELVDMADFFQLPTTLISSGPETDRFEYKVTVWKGFRRHTVRVNESAVPTTLHPLLEKLQQAARNRRDG
jgi:hypothetical protein